jgi:cytoskeletal protein RodZ
MEDFVKSRLLATLTILLGMLCWAALLQAEQTSPDTQQPPSQTQPNAQSPSTAPPETQAPPPDAQAPPSRQAPDQSGQQAPSRTGSDPQAAPSDAAGTQVFTGTVVQQGSKYVLQADNGTTYDIDHQDQVKKFEGKKVRVHGTLDASGKMIHVQ